MTDDRRAVAFHRRLQVRHLFALVPMFLLAVQASRPIVDNSFLWHVRAGAAQLDAGRVLTTDPFSYSMAGTPWRTQSWLAELFYASLERITGGIGWTPWFVFGASALALGLVGIAIYRSTSDTVAVGLWSLIMAWLAVPLVQPRPVVVSFGLLAALVLVSEDDERLAWIVPGLVWVYAAVHGSWILGIGLLVLQSVRRRSWRLLAATGIGLVFATLTAHGLGVWEFLIVFARNRGALGMLGEWQPPEFGDILQAPYVLLIAGVLWAAVGGKLRSRDLILILPFLFFGLTTKRAVYPAAIVLAPFAARAWTPGERLRSSTGGIVVWAAGATVAALVIAPLLVVPASLDPGRFPAAAVVDLAGPQPFFHDDSVGGYLIYSRWPEEQVFVDDRAELYGETFFRRYLRATAGEYEDLFAEYGFDAVIAKANWSLVDVLESDGWKAYYRDDAFVVLRRE